MIVEAIICPDCQDLVWSRYTHDFRVCKCGAVFIDGGRDYTRYGTLKETKNAFIPDTCIVRHTVDD